MDFETAIVWAFSVAESGTYGKKASWGLYTLEEKDAYSMAMALGGGEPCLHDSRPGEHPHFHVKDMDFLGQYKHFHIWYGDVYLE